MAYKALYRTYRPQTFEEVAGQRHIVRTLKNALESGKIGHAYLFCGPRGTGKTTMAKLFAKALNCEQGVGHQCNECSNCKEVIAGSHPDVIEIDAASNNGVEQVRELIDKVNYLPIKGKYKVYIIDEVHNMTSNAFNALLKTLEEPPAHVVFILATTEPHNILPTILSRCQRYDFTKLNDGDIEERMATILEKESINYDKDAVKAIISLADGGMRDALSILDQILAYSGNNLSVDDVFNIFGLLSVKDKVDFISDINNGNTTRTLERTKSFSEGGVDLKRLAQDILEMLKDVLIYKKTGASEELTVLNENDANKLAQEIETKKLHEMISSFLKLELDFKTASNIKTMLEVAVLKLLTIDDAVASKKVSLEPTKPIEIVKETVENEEETNKPTQSTPVEQQSVSLENANPEPSTESKVPDWLVDDEQNKQNIEVEGDRYELEDSTIIKLMVTGDKAKRQTLASKWNELDSYLGHPTLGDVVALLKDGTPFVVTNKAVILQYDFEKIASKVNIKTNAEKMANILNKMIGQEVFVYALSRSECVRLLTAYQNLRQISKLPLPSECQLTMEDLKK